MDIGFTEEQELLRASARRFFENECPSAFVRQRMAEPAAMTDAGLAFSIPRRRAAAGSASST
jgi:hypothetical protein